MKVIIEFDIDNVAFEDDTEIDRVLKRCARQIYDNRDGNSYNLFNLPIKDTNGNTVGTVSIEED